MEKAPPNRALFVGLDPFFCVLVLCVSAVPFFPYERAPGFVDSDVHYADLVESLLRSDSYSVNFTDAKLHCPGLPVIIAASCATIGCSHGLGPCRFSLPLLCW